MRVLYLVVVAALAGCAAQERQWTGGGSEQRFYANRAECQAMANSGGGRNQQVNAPDGGGGLLAGWNMGAAAGASAQADRIFVDCMRGRGYRIVE